MHLEHTPKLTRALYPVRDTLELLSISRTTFYQLVRQGVFQPAKIGTKTLIPAAQIATFLTKLQIAA